METPTTNELREQLEAAARGGKVTDVKLVEFERIKILGILNIAETLLAIYGSSIDGPDDDDDTDDESQRTDEPHPDYLTDWVPAVGDPVRAADDYDDLDVGTITKLGTSEGSAYAFVDWPGNGRRKVWVSALVLHNPEAAIIEGAPVNGEGIPVLTSNDGDLDNYLPHDVQEVDDMDDEEADPPAVVDDLDGDFTGEVKPLSKKELKALKAERKALREQAGA